MSRRVLVVVALLLAVSSSARADTFLLAPPSILDLDFEGNTFIFVADGFSARQDFESLVGHFFGADPGCEPCRAGDSFNPSFTVTNTDMGTGPASVGSTSYAKVSFFGDLSFSATPVTFPSTDADGVELKAPFTFRGALRGFEGQQQVFAVGLAGAGFASRFFENGFDGRFIAGENRITYFFTSAEAQTPEPASLLLLGTGAVGLLARRWRCA